MMPDKLRKAALLISSLDAASADALLDQMPDEQAAQIRRALMQLDDVDPQEQDRVLREFLRGREPAKPADHGVELDSGLWHKMQSTPAGSSTGSPPAAPAAPFQFLHEAAADELGRLLRHEHPQIAAVVMSHLPARKSADILAGFPAELQTAVLRRIADLDAADAEVLQDLEQELQTRLAGRLGGLRSAGIHAVWEILEATESPDRNALLRNLKLRDVELAQRLTQRAAAPAPVPPAPPASRQPVPTPAVAAQPELRVARSEPEVIAKRSSGSAAPQREAAALSTADLPAEREESADELAQSIPAMTFDDVMRLDNQELARLFHAAEPQVTLLALAGARTDFVQRLLGQLPTRVAKSLRHRMEQMRPLLLSDVEIAQQRLADVAATLAAQGLIEVPEVLGFAAAA